MPHAEISVQHDPIRAIVAAAQQFGISIAQRLSHAWELSIFSGVTQNAYLPLRFEFYCPERASFSRRSPRKSVLRYLSRIDSEILTDSARGEFLNLGVAWYF